MISTLSPFFHFTITTFFFSSFSFYLKDTATVWRVTSMERYLTLTFLLVIEWNFLQRKGYICCFFVHFPLNLNFNFLFSTFQYQLNLLKQQQHFTLQQLLKGQIYYISLSLSLWCLFLLVRRIFRNNLALNVLSPCVGPFFLLFTPFSWLEKYFPLFWWCHQTAIFTFIRSKWRLFNCSFSSFTPT